MDFLDESSLDCNMKPGRAQRRDRDSHMSQVAYMKTQDKKAAKQRCRSASIGKLAEAVVNAASAPVDAVPVDAADAGKKEVKPRGRSASEKPSISDSADVTDNGVNDMTTPVKPRKRSKKRSDVEEEKENQEVIPQVEVQPDDSTTPVKSSPQTKRRSMSEGNELEDVKEKGEANSSRSRSRNPEDEGVGSHRRKLSKSAIKRQQDLERKQTSRHANATAIEKAKEDEAVVAEAEAAAARRRAVWEAKDEAAKAFALKAEAEKKYADNLNEDLLLALEAEAKAATAAFCGNKEGKVEVTKPSMSGDTNDLEDPDLEGWEIL